MLWRDRSFVYTVFGRSDFLELVLKHFVSIQVVAIVFALVTPIQIFKRLFYAAMYVYKFLFIYFMSRILLSSPPL